MMAMTMTMMITVSMYFFLIYFTTPPKRTDPRPPRPIPLRHMMEMVFFGDGYGVLASVSKIQLPWPGDGGGHRRGTSSISTPGPLARLLPTATEAARTP